ncbi:Hypothetical predicted protein [Paramuricea clavata]|uniref:Uncharacterized protein n=1 Tax=Paramuricea clavata TaxID=317549 RepID=A0A6S7H6N9_PARCT|nr:Hypothetical predicted protein [Paramuricea clavata]
MAEHHHSSESNSSDSDIEETDVIDPILVATNAGASLTVPQSASISRKRKIHVNQGKYKGRGSSLSAVKSVSTWDRKVHLTNTSSQASIPEEFLVFRKIRKRASQSYSVCKELIRKIMEAGRLYHKICDCFGLR